MLTCEMVQRDLPQYVADGEPRLWSYAAVRAHLEGCARCSAYAGRLRAVEGALHQLPLLVANRALTRRVMEHIETQEQPQQEEWHALQWDLLIPAIAILASLVVALLSLPPTTIAWRSLIEWVETPVAWSQTLGSWADTPSIRVGDPLFWAVWAGIFITTAGVGLCISLTCWNRRNTERLSDLESRLGDLANRVRSLAHRPG